MIYFIYILITVACLIYFSLHKRLEKSEFEKIHNEREKNSAPKILYLRPFDVDNDDNSNGNISDLHLFPQELDLARALIKFEYQLIAVGHPDEDLPEFGFQRIKYPHDVWKENLLSLMEESKMIIWRPYATPGVLWEIEKLLELGYRHKLIVWTEMGFEKFHDVQIARYNVFRRKSFEQISEKFPPYDNNRKFLVSSSKDEWMLFKHLHQTPIFKLISK